MTAAAARWRPSHALAVGAALLLPVAALGVSSIGGPEGGTLVTVAVLFAPAAILASLVRPDVVPVALASLAFANAGLILKESAGVTSVVRGTTLLVLAGLLVVPAHRAAALRWTPIFVALLLFVEVRWLSAVAAPSGILRDLQTYR